MLDPRLVAIGGDRIARKLYKLGFELRQLALARKLTAKGVRAKGAPTSTFRVHVQ
jgi:hypothetical protein